MECVTVIVSKGGAWVKSAVCKLDRTTYLIASVLFIYFSIIFSKKYWLTVKLKNHSITLAS